MLESFLGFTQDKPFETAEQSKLLSMGPGTLKASSRTCRPGRPGPRCLRLAAPPGRRLNVWKHYSGLILDQLTADDGKSVVAVSGPFRR